MKAPQFEHDESNAWPYKPKRSVCGLPQGYVPFGTMAHRVLLALHALGDRRLCDLSEELDADPRHGGMALSRLAKFRFIFARRKVCGVPTHERTQILWTLQPVEPTRYHRRSSADRKRRYRERLKMRAPSVFAFRGRIEISGASA